MARCLLFVSLILCPKLIGADDEVNSTVNPDDSWLSIVPTWLYVYMLIAGIADFFVNRYQAITYEISKSIPTEIGVSNVQALMTPNWIGALGWITTPFYLSLFVIFWILYVWWIGLLIALVWVFFFGLAGRVIPIPSLSIMTKMMLSELYEARESHNYPDGASGLFMMLESELINYPENKPPSLVK